MAKKYGVLVGCNYPNTPNELHGCVNDVSRMRRTLIHRFGFAPQNINVLVDTDATCTQPTGQNIRRALLEMVHLAKPGDILFFHYSGHGTLVPAHRGHRRGHARDECIVPSDFNLLTDEDFRSIVNEVPTGATFTMLSDSCHSGGLIAQEKQQIGPRAHKTQGELLQGGSHAKSKFLPTETLVQILRERTGNLEINGDRINEALFQLFGDNAGAKVRRDYSAKAAVTLEKDVKLQRDPDMGILLSGCQANETSADANPTGHTRGAYGAFSNAIQRILGRHRGPINHRELVLRARKLLTEEGYSQHPCLYCSDQNVDAVFLSQAQGSLGQIREQG